MHLMYLCKYGNVTLNLTLTLRALEYHKSTAVSFYRLAKYAAMETDVPNVKEPYHAETVEITFKIVMMHILKYSESLH